MQVATWWLVTHQVIIVLFAALFTELLGHLVVVVHLRLIGGWRGHDLLLMHHLISTSAGLLLFLIYTKANKHLFNSHIESYACIIHHCSLSTPQYLFSHLMAIEEEVINKISLIKGAKERIASAK